MGVSTMYNKGVNIMTNKGVCTMTNKGASTMTTLKDYDYTMAILTVITTHFLEFFER